MIDTAFLLALENLSEFEMAPVNQSALGGQIRARAHVKVNLVVNMNYCDLY